MTGDQTASFLYLALLGSVLVGYFFLTHRQSLGQGLRQAGLWALIFLGVIAAYGLWTDIQGTVTPRQAVFSDEGRIEVPKSGDGHYHMTLEVNGTPVRFVVDTGASDIVLSAEDARRVGIDPDELAYAGVANTANGRVSTARVWLDEVSLGGVIEERVPALVNGGEMMGSLLGMSYLDRFAEIRIGGDRLTLIR
ncbi:MAG: TIGR02281 family clan AA aspartic protease [Deinococcus-Thermus bacterium]|jgi:aspartyl protease family protein|nr:TIGR02281 family clan AA aspartic protease [Deinococcota bacterium]